MPGVGKSTLAIKYGYSRTRANPLARVCFFQAETEANLKADFADLARQLRITEEQDKLRLILVNQELHKINDLEILFIFDNVEDYELVNKYVCNLPEAISVLVTVRNKDTLQLNDDEWHNIELGPSEESTECIQKVPGGSSEIKAFSSHRFGCCFHPSCSNKIIDEQLTDDELSKLIIRNQELRERELIRIGYCFD